MKSQNSLSKQLIFSILCFTVLTSICVAQHLEVKNPGTKYAHLVYDNKPLFAFGPMNELVTFEMKLGASVYDVNAWAKWQEENGMNYVRCYPTSGYGWSRELIDRDDHLFPCCMNAVSLSLMTWMERF